MDIDEDIVEEPPSAPAPGRAQPQAEDQGYETLDDGLVVKLADKDEAVTNKVIVCHVSKTLALDRPSLIVMPTARVLVTQLHEETGKKKEFGTALLDSGASKSFIGKNLVNRAKLRTAKADRPVKVIGVSGEAFTEEEVLCRLTATTYGGSQYIQHTFMVLEDMGSVKGIPMHHEEFDPLLAHKYIQMSDKFPSETRPIDFLLGQDLLWSVWSHEEPILQLESQHMLLHPSLFGWVAQGQWIEPDEASKKISLKKERHQVALHQGEPTWHMLHPAYKEDSEQPQGIVHAMLALGKRDVPVEKYVQKRQQIVSKQLLKHLDSKAENTLLADTAEEWTQEKELDIYSKMNKFFTFESLGMMDDPEDNAKLVDKQAVESLMNSLSFKDGFYSVGLTFAPDAGPLRDGKPVAAARLKGLRRRIEKNKTLQELYEGAIQEYIALGDIERCGNRGRTGRTYYLPHSAVIKMEKTTSKIRIVFNGSSKAQDGKSLNDHLLTGPPSNQDLFKILVGFREHEVALQGDVKRMYMCILINEEDRDCLRFLWINSRGEEEEWRFRKVPFGIRDAPFLAQYIFVLHAKKYEDKHPDIVDFIANKRWVDDLVASVRTAQEAKNYVKVTTEIMAEGGFNLKKWVFFFPGSHGRHPS